MSWVGDLVSNMGIGGGGIGGGFKLGGIPIPEPNPILRPNQNSQFQADKAAHSPLTGIGNAVSDAGKMVSAGNDATPYMNPSLLGSGAHSGADQLSPAVAKYLDMVKPQTPLSAYLGIK